MPLYLEQTDSVTAICAEQVMVYFDARYWHLPADTEKSLFLLRVLFNDTVNR